MEEDGATTEVDPHLVARIVGSYVRHHKVAADQLAGLISGVGQSLAGLGHAAPPEEDRVPAVSVRRSVQRDHVVCLECGFRGLMLRRHLTIAHGLDVRAYRARWKLTAAHPLVAPSYSERRSVLAKQRGLGRPAAAVASSAKARASKNGSPAGAAEPDPALAAALSTPPQPRPRGRPRRSQSAA